MKKYLTVVLAALAGIAAWLVRGFFAQRTEQRLTQQRDEALITGKQQAINAQAKASEAELLKTQQHKEDKIHATDSDQLASELDDAFKW